MQNLSAQDTILRGLSDVNAQLTSKRKELKNLTQNRNQFVDSLISSYENVDGCCEKCQNGIDFFKKLQNTSESIASELKAIVSKKKENQNSERVRESKQYEMQAPAQPQVETLGNQPYFKRPTAKTNIGISSIVQDSERPKLKDFLPSIKPNTWSKENIQTETDSIRYANQRLNEQQPLPFAQPHLTSLTGLSHQLDFHSQGSDQKQPGIPKTGLQAMDQNMAMYGLQMGYASDTLGNMTLEPNFNQFRSTAFNQPDINLNSFVPNMAQQNSNQFTNPYQGYPQPAQINQMTPQPNPQNYSPIPQQAHSNYSPMQPPTQPNYSQIPQQIQSNYSPMQPQTQLNYSQVPQINLNQIPQVGYNQTNKIEFKKPLVPTSPPVQQSNNPSVSKQPDTSLTTNPSSVYRPGFFNKLPYMP
jgi:hypothetical protein